MFARPGIRDDRGTAAVEFALVMPVFLGLILAIYWAGWVAHCTHSVRFALAEGARALQLKPSITQSALQTLVRNNAYIGQDAAAIGVTLSFDPVSGGAQLAHTTATYPVSVMIPFIGTYSINYSVAMTVAVSAS